MRKPHNSSRPEHATSEIQNSKLIVRGLKSMDMSVEKLDSFFFNMPQYGDQEYAKLYKKYLRQDWKTGYNVLLRILGIGDDINEYLKMK